MSFPGNTFNMNKVMNAPPRPLPNRPSIPTGAIDPNFFVETYQGTHTCEGCKRDTKVVLKVQRQGGAYVEDKTRCLTPAVEGDGNINISLKINARRPITIPTRDEKHIAMYDFNSTQDSELSLNKGELVTILERDRSGWSFVENEDAKTGWAPEAYLKKAGWRSEPPMRAITAPPPYFEN